ncbi:hypothetical protein C8A05DRAFT_38629, partial [Staphylotrichum tortipilum]
MLLRHTSPHNLDPDIFHNMASSHPDPSLHHADIPTTNPNFTTPSNFTTNDDENNLDDIWGSDSPPSSYPHHHHQTQPSEIPHLSRAHTTAGYRDGIAAAKALSAQPGFDEGYPLGAALGARAGQLLGVMEGLAAAAGLHALSHDSSGRGGCQGEGERIGRLLTEARRELTAPGVFGGEYFGERGDWSYPVEGGGGVVFGDVAEAHPLLRKWRGIVRGE